MRKYKCSAFAIRCFELCASRNPANRKFTPCATHSLLKDSGHPSACEADMNALLAMMIEMYISKKSVYMGNPIFHKEKNIVRITHDVPGLKMRGFSEPDAPYEIRSFTSQGWGSTIRYDFSRDKGQTVTLSRFDPTASKLLLAKGTIVGGYGMRDVGCSLGLGVKVSDALDFFHKQSITGHHLAIVYGDYTKEIKELSRIMKFEIIEV